MNPSHLSWEARAESQSRGTRNQRHSSQTKLTEEDVRTIRELKDTLSYRAIAQRFGISPASVGMIMRGERWGRSRTRAAEG
ncbi:hypothetical protein GCM10028812_52970 [Ancylobacter sonchi]